MTLKTWARCEDMHLVTAQCWDFAGYYMLKELPPQWHWAVEFVKEIYPQGMVVTSLPWEQDAALKDWWHAQDPDRRHQMFDGSRGEEPSQEEALKIAKQYHAVLCTKPLEPLTRWDHEYGWTEDDE